MRDETRRDAIDRCPRALVLARTGRARARRRRSDAVERLRVPMMMTTERDAGAARGRVVRDDARARVIETDARDSFATP